MTLADFIKLTRRKLDDLIGTSSGLGWSDDDVSDYLYEVSAEVAQETRCIRDDTTVAVCTIPTVTGTSYYPVHAAVIEILDMEIATATARTKLPVAPESYVSSQCINWKTTDGVPSLYVLAGEGFRLDRVPVEDGVISLSVVRGVVDRPTTKTDPCSEIPERYHNQLLNGVLARAFMKPDTEFYSRFKGDAYIQMQLKATEQIKRTELRRRKGM